MEFPSFTWVFLNVLMPMFITRLKIANTAKPKKNTCLLDNSKNHPWVFSPPFNPDVYAYMYNKQPKTINMENDFIKLATR